MKPREVMKKLKEAGWTEGAGSEHTITAVSPTGVQSSDFKPSRKRHPAGNAEKN